MFGSVFRPYGRVWNILNHITDVLCLSLLWCACCLPLVTVAPATTALYDAAVRCVRFGEEGACRRFFAAFRRELKQGIPITLFWGAILLFGAYVLTLLEEIGQTDSRAAVMAGAYRAVLLLPIAAACWSVMIQSRFSQRFGELLLLSVRYLPGHFLQSAAIAVFTWAVYWYCSEYPVGLLFAPAVCALGWSFPAEHVFAKYGAALQRPGQPEEDTP